MMLANLSADEQREFWLVQAHLASQKLGLRDISLIWLGYTHNAVFRVDAADGARYVMRLGQYDDDLLAYTKIQGRWLAGLASEIVVQRPAFTDPDTSIVVLEDAPIPILASLWQYLSGTALHVDKLTPATAGQIARVLGALHQSRVRYEPSLPVLNYQGLFGQAGRYAIADDAFTHDQMQTMAQALVPVKHTMEALSALHTDVQHVQGMLHGDLLTKNIIMMPDGRVGAIDFEYAGWGHFLYDLAPLLWQLMPRPDYIPLADAFWQAYNDAMPYPVGARVQLDVLIVARQIASLRWLSLNRHNPAISATYDAVVAQRLDELRVFVTTGIFHRH